MKQATYEEVTLPVGEIEALGVLQVRVKADKTTLKDYTAAIAAGAQMPPLVVFAEKGSERYLLADGLHRLQAMKNNSVETAVCHLYQGGTREAMAYALGANDTHGLRRNNKDKRHAVMMALKDPEWSTWSHLEISRLCRVSDDLVKTVREEMVLAGEIDAPETVKTMRDGKEVERKPTRAPSFKKRDESNSSEKTKRSEKPPLTDQQKKVAREVRDSAERQRPKPRSQDQVNRDEFVASLTAIRLMPHDGAEAVQRWDLENRLDELVHVRDWLNEAIEAIRGKAAA